MASTQKIALLGFLPWRDDARRLDVRENPSSLAASRADLRLVERGHDASALGIEVSDAGISEAIREVEALSAAVVVAFGQTSGAPRVERFGRVPLASRPAGPEEPSPWLLAPDAALLVTALEPLVLPAAGLEPLTVSDDAGAYFCDHLCVELVRLAVRRGARARFLHVTAIDGCSEAMREARLETYARQAVHLAERLSARAEA